MRVTVKAEMDKKGDAITFQIDPERSRGNCYNRSETSRLIKKVFGRMVWESYYENRYPFFPCWLNLARHISCIESSRIEYKTEEEERKYELSAERVKAALKRAVRKQIILDKNIIKNAVREELKNERKEEIAAGIPQNVETIIGSDITVSAEDAINIQLMLQQLCDDAYSTIDTLCDESAPRLRFKKCDKIKRDIPITIPTLEFTFKVEEDELVVWMDGSLAQTIKLLLPLINSYRERTEKIKKWRVNGVPVEERDYEPKGKYAPYPHQWVMYKIHQVLPKSADLSQMGTGKTFATLMCIDKKLQIKEIESGKVLVVCPATVVEQWENQIKLHTPHLTSKIIKGSFGERFRIIMSDDSEPDIYITNYESFVMRSELKNGKELMLSKAFGLIEWDMVVLDECHRIKNPEAKRTTQIISAFKNVPNAIVMSGTISANKLYDCHPPLVFLNNARGFNSVLEHHDGSPLSVGELLGDFQRAYFMKNQSGLVPMKGTIEEVKQKLEECSVRFEKRECLNLPDKTYELRLVELSPKHQELYNNLRDHLVAELSDVVEKAGRVSAVNALAVMTKLAEAANGWIFDNHGRLIEFPWNPKVDAVLEVIEDIDDGETKAVVWSRFTQDLHKLADELRKVYGRDAVGVVHGSEYCSVCGARKSERFSITQRFNDRANPLRFVVANTAAGGEGIDLTGADYEFFFANSFVKTHRPQSEDRCHRPGMRPKLVIVDVVAKDTIDEKVIESLKSWKSMHVALMESLGVDPGLLDEELRKDEAPVIIEHVEQSRGECLVASVAMLARTNPAEIKDWYTSISGKPTWTWLSAEGCNWEAGFSIIHQFLPMMDITKVEQAISEMEGKDEGDKQRLLHLDMRQESIPPKGAGLAWVRWPSTRHHVAAFEDGIIHDPGYPLAKTVSEWVVKIGESGGCAVFVTMLPSDKNKSKNGSENGDARED